MPTYQYACTECQHSFEQVQSFNDDALTVCPQCQGRLRKVYNAVGVVFKGSGFYRNDSRPGGPDGPDAKPSSDGTSTTKDATKGDAKTPDASKGDGAGTGTATKDAAATSKPAAGGGSSTTRTSTAKGSTSAA